MANLTAFRVFNEDVLPTFLIEKMNQNKRGQRHEKFQVQVTKFQVAREVEIERERVYEV